MILRRQAATASRDAGVVADAAAIEKDADRLEEQMRVIIRINEESGLPSLESVVLPMDSAARDPKE